MSLKRKAILTSTLFVAAMAVVGCGGEPAETVALESGAPVPVTIATAALETMSSTFEATGSTEPWVRVSPGTKIMGRVETASFREGDRVRKGQVLVGLEKRDLQAAVAQARAAVTMAEANLENAGSQHQRMIALHQKGSVTDKMLEDAVAGFRVAEASVAQAKANLSAADVTLSYADVSTPVSGWVVAKMIEVGDMAGPGAPLFTVEDLSRIKVVLNVSESDVAGLSVGDPVRVDVLGETLDAKVDRVVPSGDPQSRTYRVQMVLLNDDGRLKSGMFVRASFAKGTREAILVPASAVVERGQMQGLFVVDADDRARLRWIRLGRVADDGVEVLSGLQQGERFVTASVAGLVDGSRVEVR